MVSDDNRNGGHRRGQPGVLILLLMEYGLGHDNNYYIRTFRCNVLILLLMEYGLGLKVCLLIKRQSNTGLNPSFNGIWSRTTREVAPVES